MLLRNMSYNIIEIERTWCGWDRIEEERIIGTYSTLEEAERNKPEDIKQYAGGDDYNTFYNYIKYKIV